METLQTKTKPVRTAS